MSKMSNKAIEIEIEEREYFDEAKFHDIMKIVSELMNDLNKNYEHSQKIILSDFRIKLRALL